MLSNIYGFRNGISVVWYEDNHLWTMYNLDKVYYGMSVVNVVQSDESPFRTTDLYM